MKPSGKEKIFVSWGGFRPYAATAIVPENWRNATSPVLAFGNGRSYADTALLDQGRMIQSREHAKLLSFDETTGIAIAESGLLIADLIDQLLPLGWFPPVVPGTCLVTLGGALANDIHGKNHHVAGTFGCHVLWFDLERSDGPNLRCSREDNAELFAATIGGFGLTGYISRMAIQMMPAPSASIDAETIPFDDLAGFFRLAAQSDATHAYSVAWIDSLAKGTALGRGVYFRGNHAPSGPEKRKAGRLKAGVPGLSVPFTLPFSLLNRLSLAGFNQAYRFTHRKPARQSSDIKPFFFPLDSISHWNRLYGRRGLRQFQSVVPMADAVQAITALIDATHAAGAASFLTVLKVFGDRPSPGMLSFPIQGATLTLDFPYRGAATDRLLERLTDITMQAGGRINPYKHSHLSAHAFRQGFPDLERFRRSIDPAFTSNFWRRMQPASLTEPARTPHLGA
jgi:FAD/FMN-containing dehydrogenase